jgi:hypothetical protein
MSDGTHSNFDDVVISGVCSFIRELAMATYASCVLRIGTGTVDL